MATFTEDTVHIIKNIPPGRVATYGQIARMAGNPRAARQVVRVLNTQSKKYALPWHRIVNSKGRISIEDPYGREVQKSRLIAEGIDVSENFRVDLEKYLWRGFT